MKAVSQQKISVVMPAHNEATFIGDMIANCKAFCDEIVVIDDGSTDDTSRIATQSGAIVVRNETNRGILQTILKGFKTAHGNIIVTLDADGQHDPADIPKLVNPLKHGKCEVVLGVRAKIPQRSERIINQLTNLRVKCSDSGTGFRALTAQLAKNIELHGTCLCGTFVLEAVKRGARILEIPIHVNLRMSGEKK